MSGELKAGRSLDERIATEVMGETLRVPRERAMAILGASYVSVTGRTWQLRVHGYDLSVKMPEGEILLSHPSDNNFNQRYFRHAVAELLTYPNEIAEIVEQDIQACRLAPSPYSTSIADAWVVVEAVQKAHPGWRFSLLGGDEQWGYRKVAEDEYVAVPTASSRFGWHARFFGGIDPTIAYPMSNGEAHAVTPELAICRAALAALSSAPPILTGESK